MYETFVQYLRKFETRLFCSQICCYTQNRAWWMLWCKSSSIYSIYHGRWSDDIEIKNDPIGSYNFVYLLYLGSSTNPAPTIFRNICWIQRGDHHPISICFWHILFSGSYFKSHFRKIWKQDESKIFIYPKLNDPSDMHLSVWRLMLHWWSGTISWSSPSPSDMFWNGNCSKLGFIISSSSRSVS